jgi:hypothetical protein
MNQLLKLEERVIALEEASCTINKLDERVNALEEMIHAIKKELPSYAKTCPPCKTELRCASCGEIETDCDCPMCWGCGEKNCPGKGCC